MTTRPQHPLAEEYFAGLRPSASQLPRRQRTELLSELRSHLDSGVAEADSDADVRNMLDALGPPDDIVEASSPPSEAKPPTGRHALSVGVAALILMPTLLIPLVLGLAAIGLGVRARRSLRSNEQPTTVATAAIILGAAAIIIPTITAILLITSS